MQLARLSVSALSIALLLIASSPLAALAAEGPQNPAPARKLGGFTRYELKPMTIAPELTSKKNSDKVISTLQEHLERNVAPIIAQWNAEAGTAPESSETLVIEPRVTSLHKPSGATRFFAGAFAGDGRIVVKVRIVEAGSGNVIAEPEFYRRAAAMAGAWTVGGHDNAMLGKVIGLVADYLNANYTTAAGGPTGYEP
jgi:hypothetical protein